MTDQDVLVEKLDRVIELAEEIKHSVYGNGKPGLIERVARLETAGKVLAGALTGLIAALGVIAAWVR